MGDNWRKNKWAKNIRDREDFDVIIYWHYIASKKDTPNEVNEVIYESTQY
jgi:hypothetical protein